LEIKSALYLTGRYSLLERLHGVARKTQTRMRAFGIGSGKSSDTDKQVTNPNR
jgi:hypothetical protein